MATKEMVITQIQKLSRHHPQYKLTPEMLDDYFEVLEGCIPEYLTSGVSTLLGTSKWFPKPAEILEAHEQAMLASLESRWGRGNVNKIVTTHYKD